MRDVEDKNAQTTRVAGTRFPNPFRYGQDTLSQGQIAEFARMIGWKIALSRGSLRASKEGVDVILPATSACYSRAQTAELMRRLQPEVFVQPARGVPGSLEFEALLDRYRRTGLPTVGVGRRWGPLMPRIIEATAEAPDLLALDRDMQAVAKQRWEWAQPWHDLEVTGENRDEMLLRAERWKPETQRHALATKWRPLAHPAICMWASSARQISGRSYDWIETNVLEVKERTVKRAILRGDQLWASLGAWPWGHYPEGQLPRRWWELDEPWERLDRAMPAPRSTTPRDP